MAREAMVERMVSAGEVATPRLIEAARRIPRHMFTSSFFRGDHTGDWTIWQPTPNPSEDELLGVAYSDETWVTQLDGHITPESAGGPVPGIPTSSATMPSLVLRMFEDGYITSARDVLEIGTGTGYSTAVLCEVLGAHAVTSIDIDEQVLDRAGRTLAEAGYAPYLVETDGLLGLPERAPYDRIIATCGFHRVPRNWLHQVRPGGFILVTIGGHFGASQLARVQVTRPGYAEGAFLPGGVSYLVARTEPSRPALGNLSCRTAYPDVTAVIDKAQALGTLMERWVAQIAAPGAELAQVAIGGVPNTFLFAGESFATLTPHGDLWQVAQGGPRRLWDEAVAGLAAWEDAGRPGPDAFHIAITPAECRVTLRGPHGETSWTL